MSQEVHIASRLASMDNISSEPFCLLVLKLSPPDSRIVSVLLETFEERFLFSYFYHSILVK